MSTAQTKHSPEPWAIHPNDPTLIVIPDNPPFEIGECCSNGLTDLDCANAARIVACVNFCAGVSTDVLGLSSSSKPLKDYFEDERKRDEELTQICEENQSLRKQLAEAQKEDRRKDEEASKMFDALQLELTNLRAELAKNKAAREALNNQMLWLERHLQTLHPRQSGHPVKPNGWSVVEIPDWDVKQKISELHALIQPEEKK